MTSDEPASEDAEPSAFDKLQIPPSDNQKAWEAPSDDLTSSSTIETRSEPQSLTGMTSTTIKTCSIALMILELMVTLGYITAAWCAHLDVVQLPTGDVVLSFVITVCGLWLAHWLLFRGAPAIKRRSVASKMTLPVLILATLILSNSLIMIVVNDQWPYMAFYTLLVLTGMVAVAEALHERAVELNKHQEAVARRVATPTLPEAVVPLQSSRGGIGYPSEPPVEDMRGFFLPPSTTKEPDNPSSTP